MNDIDEFTGHNRYLSNFFPAMVYLAGVKYLTVEHAYQAAKFPAEVRDQFVNSTNGAAAKTLCKHLVKMHPINPQWNADGGRVKLAYMEALVRQKFNSDAWFVGRLLSTGACNIIEGNTWGDTFWGVCQGRGENNLGKILMRVRTELRELGPNAQRARELTPH